MSITLKCLSHTPLRGLNDPGAEVEAEEAAIAFFGEDRRRLIEVRLEAQRRLDMGDGLALGAEPGFHMALEAGVIGIRLGIALRARQGAVGTGQIALLQLQASQGNSPAGLRRHVLQAILQDDHRFVEFAGIEQLAQQQSMYEKQQREMAHMQSYVDRFRYKASKARQAQSRLKAMERMEKILPAHADSEFSFEFREPSALPTPLIAMENLCAGYGDKVILEKIKMNLVPGSRIGLLGRNGAGKSTFIKMLSGSNAPLSGKLEVSAGVSIGYFAQHQLETLRLDDTPLDHLARLAPDKSEQELRNYLGSFGFHGDKALDKVAPFSGGEKARLALALTGGGGLALLAGVLLLGQFGEQRGGQRAQAQAIVVDPFGQVAQFVQALAQAVADGQPVIAAQCDEAARAGLEQHARSLKHRHPSALRLA